MTFQYTNWSYTWVKLLAGLVFPKVIIEKIFSEVINMIRIEDSVIYQDVIENGIKQGIEKGIKKGKSQGKIEILMRQLKRKFKTFPAI